MPRGRTKLDLAPKECGWCKKHYMPSRTNYWKQKYCSYSCGASCRVRRVIANLPMRACAYCGITFKPNVQNKKYCNDLCMYKGNYYKNPERSREQARMKTAKRRTPEISRVGNLRKYNLTPADFREMYLKQGGRCAICDESHPPATGRKQGLCVDHDHETDAVRGLLCRNCNTGLGMFGDDPVIIERAIEYLRQYGKEARTA